MMKDNFWNDANVVEYLNSNYAPERGESKEVNERCMDNFKKSKSINMEDIKLTIGNTSYNLERIGTDNRFYAVPTVTFKGEVYQGIAIPNEQVKRDFEILERFKYNERAVDGDIGAIKKVKRLSDNVVFSVGDNTDKGKIYAFEIAGKEMIVKFDCNYPGSSRGGFCNINFLSKPVERPILFTTEDGVPIYYMTKYWIVTPEFEIDWFCGKMELSGKNENNKYFSTKEAAELFCLENKPCLSVNDFKSCSSETERLNEDNPHFMKLIELAKTKL